MTTYPGLQGIKEGWYDGASIAFAVLLVVFVTGMLCFHNHFPCLRLCMGAAVNLKNILVCCSF
jgi:hypothetical protein